jgi:hypothetical protein
MLRGRLQHSIDRAFVLGPSSIPSPPRRPGHDAARNTMRHGMGRRVTCIGRTGGTMSKKTSKRKLKSRRNKANHGKRPNAGRR